MPRALSSNVQLGMGERAEPCYLLEVESSAATYRWATRTFTDGAQTYSGDRLLRNGLGKITTRIDIRRGGNIAEVAGFRFELANADLFSDAIAGEYFENRRVELRLIFPDFADASWANAVVLFRGFTQHMAWDTEKITFDCKDGWRKWGQLLPKRIVTVEEFPYLPQGNVGKAFPIIYGDFYGTPLHKDSIAAQYTSGRGHPLDFVKVYVLRPGEGVTPTDVGIVLVAGHDIKTFRPLAGDVLADFIDNRKVWSRTDMSDGAGSLSGGAYYRINCSAAQRGTAWDTDIVPLLKSQLGTTNGNLAVDTNPANWATLTAGQSATFRIPSAALKELPDLNTGSVILWCDFARSGISDDVLRITITKPNEPVPPNGVIVTDVLPSLFDGHSKPAVKLTSSEPGLPLGGQATGGAATYLDDTAKSWTTNQWAGFYLKLFKNVFAAGHEVREIVSNTATRLTVSAAFSAPPVSGERYEIHFRGEWDFATINGYEELQIKLEYVTVGGNDGGTFSFRNLYLRGRSQTPELRAELYATLEGRKYGAWIDDASHSNSFNAGDLIESPAYLIESLLLDEAGATLNNIAASAFDALHTLRSSWKVARQIRERRDLYDFLAEIAFEFGFACFERSDGKFTLRRIDASAELVGTYTTAFYAMRGADTTFAVERGDVKDVRNDFVLRYRVNAATGDPEQTLFVKSPEAASYDAGYTNLTSEGAAYWQKCRDAYVNFGQKNTWDYTAQWIRDDMTAQRFLKFSIERLTRRPHTARFVAPLATLDLELLDEAKLSHDLLPPGVDGAARFRLIEQEIDPASDTITNGFLEVV